jgi:uncharacterized protein (TIGR03067 family)
MLRPSSCLLALWLFGGLSYAGPIEKLSEQGVAALNKGDNQGAIAKLTDALRFEPNSARLYAFRGVARRNLRQFEQALADFEQSIKIEPNAYAFNNRGLLFRMRGEADKALADFGQAIRLDPGFDAAYMNRALVYAEKGDYDKALGGIDASIALNDKNPQAHAIRGSILRDKRDLDKAIDSFGRAIALDPNYAFVYQERAQAYEQKKQFDNAARDLESAVRLNPTSVDALNSLAWLLATCADPKVRDGKKAVVHARNACVLTKWTNASLVDTLAAAHAEAGDFNEAVSFAKKAVALAEKEPKEFREAMAAHLRTFERNTTLANEASQATTTTDDLVGSWRGTTVEMKGNKSAHKDVWEFQKDGSLVLRLAIAGAKAVAWHYRVDGTKNPIEVDLTIREGVTTKGILEIRNGTLRICYISPNAANLPTRPRPTTFDTAARDDVVMLSFERSK